MAVKKKASVKATRRSHWQIVMGNHARDSHAITQNMVQASDGIALVALNKDLSSKIDAVQLSLDLMTIRERVDNINSKLRKYGA